jgi:hypothetical protein
MPLHRMAWLLCALAALGRAGEAAIAVRDGRITVTVDGAAIPFSGYSAVGWDERVFARNLATMGPRRPTVWFVSALRGGDDGWNSCVFWRGDEVFDEPYAAPRQPTTQQQMERILALSPDTWFIVRNGPAEAMPSWMRANPDECFLTPDGKRLDFPSLASAAFWDRLSLAMAATARWMQRQPHSERIIGYWMGFAGEGTYIPVFMGQGIDHSPAMLRAWRAYLTERYRDDAGLRAAHGARAGAIADSKPPTSTLGPGPYWPDPTANRSRADYLELLGGLVRSGYATCMTRLREAAGPGRLLIYDAFKTPMQGWNNPGFFDARTAWTPRWPEPLAWSGQRGLAELFSHAGMDGAVTPQDYQFRGVGGITEPEGAADSLVLRGKLFCCEFDTRTWNEKGQSNFGVARDAREFAAISWRDCATALTRGWSGYWMDLYQDWFAGPEIAAVWQRQQEVQRLALAWPRADQPGIAVVVDDTAVADTDGSGAVLDEAVMGQIRGGLARCGVPYRVYLLDDLALDNLPPHRLWYFPGLHRIDEQRLARIAAVCKRDGRVVVWGPGAGISDGRSRSPAHALRLTGFAWRELSPADGPRRAVFSAGGAFAAIAGSAAGSPLAYGPLWLPTDGEPLAIGQALKLGSVLPTVALKRFGEGEGRWISIASAATPLPAGFWREAARLAGAHVWHEGDGVLLAERSLVALHSVSPGEKRLVLPRPSRVLDLIAGTELPGGALREIRWQAQPPETRFFRLLDP